MDGIRAFAAKPYSREAFVGGLLLAAFGVMTTRLMYLQAFATGELATTAKNERTARKTLYHRRGAIYDRDGNVLAQSVDAVDVAAHPAYSIPDSSSPTGRSWVANYTDPAPIANLLASVLGGSAQAYAQKLTMPETAYVYLEKRADPECVERLRSGLAAINIERRKAQPPLPEYPAFEFEETSRRKYPLGEVAGNVIGCVGTDGHGLTGLELQYDEVLSGTDGYIIEERSLYGSPVVGGQSERVDPVDGENIVISIDTDIQRVAQDQLLNIIQTWGAGDGCVVVMQPETGELLACASTPLLNPQDFSQAPVEAFNLRCVSDSYEPGSTIKPVTASMAIDLGLATPNTTYWAPVRIDVGTDSVGDADNRNYEMDMSLTNMLERSSNVGAVLCAESVGAVQFSQYLERYQIGHLTGVDYPGEALGLVPKLENYTGAWEAMAFGQSLAVPPVQMARAIGAIANEGIMVTPHFLVNRGGSAVEYPEGERVIATATAEDVAWMMYSVTENGYGRTGRIEGYRLSSKTGTAERAAETGGYLDGLYTVSFIGFGPTDDPKLLVYVLVDYVPEATGSEAVGSAWAVIMQAALNKFQIPPSW